MVLQRADSIVRTMLSDTILALCRNTLSYEGEVCIEGLLGITVDQKEVFLVHLNETIQKEGFSKTKSKKRDRTEEVNQSSEESGSQDSDSDSQSQSGSVKKKRRRRRKSKEKEKSSAEEESNSNIQKEDYKEEERRVSEDEVDRDGENSVNDEDSNISSAQVKNEWTEGDEDIVFVKEEPHDPAAYGQSQSFNMPGTSQAGDSNSQHFGQDPALELSQLQELAFQLSGDMSSSPGTRLKNMGPQISQSSSAASSFQSPAGGSSDQDLLDFGNMPNLMQLSQLYTASTVTTTCRLCGKSYDSQQNLQVHLMKSHSGEKTYACDQCGSAYKSSIQLHDHIQQQHPIRASSHRCELCGKTFASSQNLRVHMRSHTGERPYKCDTCGRGFITTNHLKVHKRQHTGEKPYSCPLCGVRFTQSQHVKIHVMRIHHNSTLL